MSDIARCIESICAFACDQRDTRGAESITEIQRDVGTCGIALLLHGVHAGAVMGPKGAIMTAVVKETATRIRLVSEELPRSLERLVTAMQE